MSILVITICENDVSTKLLLLVAQKSFRFLDTSIYLQYFILFIANVSQPLFVSLLLINYQQRLSLLVCYLIFDDIDLSLLGFFIRFLFSFPGLQNDARGIMQVIEEKMHIYYEMQPKVEKECDR